MRVENVPSCLMNVNRVIFQRGMPVPLYSTMLHPSCLRESTMCVRCWTVFALVFCDMVVNHFASRSFPAEALVVVVVVVGMHNEHAYLGQIRGAYN